jgi:hypothetical protein
MDGVNKKILASFQGLRNKVTKKDKKDKKDKDKDKDSHDKKEKDKGKIIPEKSSANGTSEKLVPSGPKRDVDDVKPAAILSKSGALEKPDTNEPEVSTFYF